MNLETKFGTLETQLAQQHQATLIAINALLTALGVPPPEPGATLADVLGALNQIAVELSSLTTAMTAQHAAQLLKLTDIWTTLDLLNNNNALNTQLLLTALAANNCCNPTNPALPLPLLTNPTSLADQEKCRRIQFYLAWFGSWIDNIANFGGLGATLTGATLSTLLTTAIPAGTVVGGEIGAAGGIPGAVIGAILGLLISAAYALGSALFGTLSTQWHTAPLYDQLLHALYQANDAASGYAAFQSTVSASGVLNPVWKGVINALFWTGWANDIYNTVPVVDDSGFDGSICAPANLPPTECVTLNSTLVAQLPRPHPNEVLPNVHAIVVPSWATGTDSITFPNFPPYSYGSTVIWVGNFVGWTIHLVSGPLVKVYGLRPEGSSFSFSVVPGGSSPIEGTSQILIAGNLDLGQSSDPFTIQLCPPGKTPS